MICSRDLEDLMLGKNARQQEERLATHPRQRREPGLRVGACGTELGPAREGPGICCTALGVCLVLLPPDGGR